MASSSVEVVQSGKAILFSMKVPVETRREGAWFYASCDVLDVHSQGRTEDEAVKNLVESMQLFVESCYERGTLESVLKDCGFRPERDVHRALRADAAGKARMVDVPLPMLVANHAAAHTC